MSPAHGKRYANFSRWPNKTRAFSYITLFDEAAKLLVVEVDDPRRRCALSGEEAWCTVDCVRRHFLGAEPESEVLAAATSCIQEHVHVGQVAFAKRSELLAENV